MATYTVKSGDWLSKIAPQFGMSWQDIYNANRNVISDPNLIYPGQVLTIPGGRQQQASVPRGSTITAAAPAPTELPSITGEAISNLESPSVRQRYVSYIKQYFPESEWKNAIKVMLGESGGRADAVGDEYEIGGVYAPSYGLFQIRALPGRPDPEQLKNPEFNVKYAAQMQQQQGWGPWTAARELGLVPGREPDPKSKKWFEQQRLGAYQSWLDEGGVS